MMPQMTGAVQGRVAPPGQSLEEMNQSRLQQQQFALQQQQLQQMQQQQQQQFPQMAPQMTGFPGQQQPLQQFQTGMPQNGPFMQPMMTGNVPPQQFTPLQNQMTGFPGGQFPQQQQQPQPFNPQATGINSFLPPALEPQRTGMPPFQPQPTGFNSAPLQPLQPQQTGPPPPVRFGVSADAKKLAPQATGRRANLSQASKSCQKYMRRVDETDNVQHRTIPSVSDFTDKTACSHSHSALRVVILMLRLLHSGMVERGGARRRRVERCQPSQRDSNLTEQSLRRRRLAAGF
jgi:hypothetical protein